MPCLSHISALECLRNPWLYATMEPVATTAFHATEPGGRRALSQGEFALPDCVSLPCHMLANAPCTIHSTETFIQHVSTRKYPEDSFLRIDRTLICSAPELCFVQMASYIPIQELIWLGCELCSDYSILNDGYIERSRLSTKRKLESYINHTKGQYGVKAARRALRYLCEGAASPSEAALTMLATLPPTLGGYALPSPTLNARVNLSKRAQAETGNTCYKCDLLWPKAKLDLEYDSDSHHTGALRIAEDALRRNTLKSDKGIDVIVVTNRQLRDPAKFNYLMHQTAKALHVKLKGRTAMSIGAEHDLREILFRHERAPRQQNSLEFAECDPELADQYS